MSAGIHNGVFSSGESVVPIFARASMPMSAGIQKGVYPSGESVVPIFARSLMPIFTPSV